MSQSLRLVRLGSGVGPGFSKSDSIASLPTVTSRFLTAKPRPCTPSAETLKGPLFAREMSLEL